MLPDARTRARVAARLIVRDHILRPSRRVMETRPALRIPGQHCGRPAPWPASSLLKPLRIIGDAPAHIFSPLQGIRTSATFRLPSCTSPNRSPPPQARIAPPDCSVPCGFTLLHAAFPALLACSCSNSPCCTISQAVAGFDLSKLLPAPPFRSSSPLRYPSQTLSGHLQNDTVGAACLP